MRLSKRERFLLAVLTLLLLWTGFYKFWIEPETDLLFANLQVLFSLGTAPFDLFFQPVDLL